MLLHGLPRLALPTVTGRWNGRAVVLLQRNYYCDRHAALMAEGRCTGDILLGRLSLLWLVETPRDM